MIREKTGLTLDAYFSATKIARILDYVSEARRRAEAGDLLAGAMDSWLAWRLTGRKRHITDASNASRTMLLDIRTGQWDASLLALFGIPASLLSSVVPSAGPLAETDPEILGFGIPISGMAGDQQADAFASQVPDNGGVFAVPAFTGLGQGMNKFRLTSCLMLLQFFIDGLMT